ncbi:MAG: hypothetical protein JWO60_345 [Frankiales bacterium]|nr:hypothetical protein [Frankiales bacterium]
MTLVRGAPLPVRPVLRDGDVLLRRCENCGTELARHGLDARGPFAAWSLRTPDGWTTVVAGRLVLGAAAPELVLRTRFTVRLGRAAPSAEDGWLCAAVGCAGWVASVVPGEIVWVRVRPLALTPCPLAHVGRQR